MTGAARQRRRRCRTILFALVVLATGPLTTHAQETNIPRKEIEDYVRCNLRQARLIASQEGDPVSLGNVANTMCPGEENLLIAALQHTYRPKKAYEMLVLLKNDVAKKNSAAVVRTRAKKSSMSGAGSLPRIAQHESDEQKRLQDEWQQCLYDTGARFAATNEPVATIVESSLAVCQPHEDGLYNFFSNNSNPVVAQFATRELFPEIRKSLESRLKAVILQERTK